MNLATKCQHLKLWGLQFHYIKWLKKEHFNFKFLAFWSQWRYHYQIQITSPYTIKIKYWNASGSGFPPSLIPALRNIGILHHKKEKLCILLQQSVLMYQKFPTHCTRCSTLVCKAKVLKSSHFMVLFIWVVYHQ